MSELRIVVVGGGAAGYFAAITAASTNPSARVMILEQSDRVLHKVSISGGGRCNVTHHCFEPKELLRFYPRGHRELIGPFHHWQPRDTIDWFRQRGVDLKVEADGRMFPVTDSSRTIVDCLQREAESCGVELRIRTGLKSVQRMPDGGFDLECSEGKYQIADRLLLATGGTRAAQGARLAESLGHHPIPAVPSLFSFRFKDGKLKGLAGVSLEQVRVRLLVPGAKPLEQSGPMLVTHEGLSGPAVLKLSAWGARTFAECGYQGEIQVDWTHGMGASALRDAFMASRRQTGKRQLKTQALFGLPQRLWERLLQFAEIPEDRRWLELKKAEEDALVRELTECRFLMDGKSMNKDEFVTCGGIPGKEVDFRSMESKLCPGLYFAGEMLDIDGVTGGFNFQAAWTTGYIAGRSIAS